MGDDDELEIAPVSQKRPLAFSFFIGKELIDKNINLADFSAMAAIDRLLFAIGQANTFRHSNGTYLQYVQRLFGRSVTSRPQPAGEFEKTVEKALEEKLIVWCDDHYELTEHSHSCLIKYTLKLAYTTNGSHNKKERTATPKSPVEITPPDKVIKPYIGKIDDERKESLDNLGYRTVQFLAELEFANGEITAKNPFLALWRRTGDRLVDATSFTKISVRMAKAGVITIDEANGSKTVRLTSLGEEYIAQLKSLPGVIENLTLWPEKLQPGTSFQIVDYIYENTNFVDSNGVHWLNPLGGDQPVIKTLAQAMNMTTDSVTRRLYELRINKCYLTQEKHYSRGGIKEITNLGVTPEGIAYRRRVIEKVRDKSKMHDDELLEEIMEMTLTAIELAEAVKEKSLAEKLRKMYDVSWLIELDSVAIEEHSFWVEKTVVRLREDYLFERTG